MKKSSLILCGLLALSGIGAQAGELYTPEQYQSPSISTTTRAQVKQETLRALAAREVSFGDVDLPILAAGPVGRTRAEVKQEVLQARAAGELHYGDVDLPQFANVAVGRSRTEVRNELFAARKPRSQAAEHNLY